MQKITAVSPLKMPKAKGGQPVSRYAAGIVIAALCVATAGALAAEAPCVKIVKRDFIPEKRAGGQAWCGNDGLIYYTDSYADSRDDVGITKLIWLNIGTGERQTIVSAPIRFNHIGHAIPAAVGTVCSADGIWMFYQATGDQKLYRYHVPSKRIKTALDVSGGVLTLTPSADGKMIYAILYEKLGSGSPEISDSIEHRVIVDFGDGTLAPKRTVLLKTRMERGRGALPPKHTVLVENPPPMRWQPYENRIVKEPLVNSRSGSYSPNRRLYLYRDVESHGAFTIVDLTSCNKSLP